MTTQVKVQVLDVGQGSGNLIEVYDGLTLTELVLVDLGSALAKSTAGMASVKHIVDQIMSLTPHVLDALILSHSDSDHVNLLKAVLDFFDPPSDPHPTKPVLTINAIFYGGSYDKYKKRKTNFLSLAEGYLPTTSDGEAVTFTNDDSSWNQKKKEWEYIHETNGVFFYLLVGNTTKEDRDFALPASKTTKKRKAEPDAYGINMKSLIIDVAYESVHWILTGDATGLTLAHANEVLVLAGPYTDCFMVTMPHHSSEGTTLDLLGASTDLLTTDELAVQNLTQFVVNIDGQTITASAEQHRTYKHPSMRVMEFFWAPLSPTVWYKDPLLGTDNHFYNAYIFKDEYQLDQGGMTVDWPPRSYWQTVQTKANVFTTLYFDATQQSGVVVPPKPLVEVTEWKPKKGVTPPPHGTQWSFNWDGTTKSIERRTNREVMLRGLAEGALPFRWPELPAMDVLRERSAVDMPSIGAALDAARVPLPLRSSVPPPPRQSASPLRGLRAFPEV